MRSQKQQTLVQGKQWLKINYRGIDIQSSINGCSVPYITKLSLMPHYYTKVPQRNPVFIAQINTISCLSNKKKEEQVIFQVQANAKLLYLLKIQQRGGGQSYHSYDYIQASDNLQKLLSSVQNYFDDCHRQQQCRSINDSQCDCQALKNTLLEDLKIGGYGNCSATGGKVESATFYIYQIPIIK